MIVLMLGFFLYNTYFNNDLPIELERDPLQAQAADALIKMSKDLESVDFKQDLFSSSGYRLLTDFSTAIPSEPVGRTNPFAAIGQD